jgi:hypothetical protein
MAYLRCRRTGWWLSWIANQRLELSACSISAVNFFLYSPDMIPLVSSFSLVGEVTSNSQVSQHIQTIHLPPSATPCGRVISLTEGGQSVSTEPQCVVPSTHAKAASWRPRPNIVVPKKLKSLQARPQESIDLVPRLAAAPKLYSGKRAVAQADSQPPLLGIECAGKIAPRRNRCPSGNLCMMRRRLIVPVSSQSAPGLSQIHLGGGRL